MLDSGGKVYWIEITQTPLFNNSLHIFFGMNGIGGRVEKGQLSCYFQYLIRAVEYFSDTQGGGERGRRGGLACVSLYGAVLLNIETLQSQPGMPLMPNVQQRCI